MSNSRPKCVELEFSAGFGCETSRADCLNIGDSPVGLVGPGDVRAARAMALFALNVNQGAAVGDVLKTTFVKACGVADEAAGIQLGRPGRQRVDCSGMRRIGPRHVFSSVTG